MSVQENTRYHELKSSTLFDGRPKYKCILTDCISLIMIRLIKIRVVELDYRTVTVCRMRKHTLCCNCKDANTASYK